ncbi:ATP synthase mitochondrial F1 complex assembly factor 2 [Olea europaea subsp. europaea]|uniref:ATP synthase mitochondrial F1 complex assembly factor 2 n=1 Tax=Olea europaea subsp. europaea TaxID=158383 RepID=A0A8S0VH50_OLEEU|nr:ATP synthase mitochondrial F1 complex assembly factor 2 [Olea europaea subsp. europaea]
MAMKRALKTLNPTILIVLTSQSRHLNSFASAGQPEPDSPSSSFTFSSSETAPTSISNKDDNIYIKNPKKTGSSVTMPISFMTGSIVGGRFFEKLTTRDANNGNRWNVMLNYRTLRTPSNRPLNCSTLALAKAIAAEWEFQQIDGIRPFTMPLMKLTCTALERVPLTRYQIIEYLMKKFHQDLVLPCSKRQ